MPTVTVFFGGICTFFMSHHHKKLDGFCRVVLVNAAHGREIDGEVILPHNAMVQIGDSEAVPVDGVHMRLLSSNDESVRTTEFTGRCPDLTRLVLTQDHALLSRPSEKVVFAGDPAAASLYFDFKGGTLEASTNQHGAVITTLIVQGDEVWLESGPFGSEPSSRTDFPEDTTIVVSNDDLVETTSKFDFYLHYLTAERVPHPPPIPRDPPIPLAPPSASVSLRDGLSRIPHFPRWFGSIGAGCSNSTYP